MYVLLIAVATCIGFTINSSCSADEDYDYSSDNNELFTRAEREMGREVENPLEPWIFEGVYLTQNISYMEDDAMDGLESVVFV